MLLAIQIVVGVIASLAILVTMIGDRYGKGRKARRSGKVG